MTNTFNALTDFFQKPLDMLAEQLSYSRDNILVLKNDEKTLQSDYPEIYQNILSCKHNRDNRTPMEYARDLVSSWLFEDYLVAKFKELGYTINFAGKDKERKILNNSNVGSQSDVIFEYNGERVKIEIVCDYSGYWKRTKKLDLRDSKFNKLKEEKAILLAVSITSKEYLIIPTNDNVKSIFIPSHRPYGWKPATQIDLMEYEFKQFFVKEIIDDVIKIIKNR